MLQLWDIAGQERYACLHRSFYKGAIGAIVVFDCTNQQSLEKAKVWKTDIDAKITWHGKKIPTILFANKVKFFVGNTIIYVFLTCDNY